MQDLRIAGDSTPEVAFSFEKTAPSTGTFISCAELGYACFCSSGCADVPGAREFAGVTRMRRDGLWLGFVSSAERQVAMIQDDRCMGDGNFHAHHPGVHADYFRVAAYGTLLMADRLWHASEITMLHPAGQCGWPEDLTEQWLQGIGECLDEHQLSLQRLRIIDSNPDRAAATFRSAAAVLNERRGERRPPIRVRDARPFNAGITARPGELVVVNASQRGWPTGRERTA
jgi:hypothetical protein